MRARPELLAATLLLAGDAFAQEVRLPPTGVGYDSQLGGAYEPPAGVGIVSRDREAQPADVYSICYINAFQTQPDDAQWWQENHPNLLLTANGALVEDENWPGEYLLDITTEARRAELLGVVGPWIDGCAEAGFEAVEGDNLDTWTRSGGLIAIQDTIAFALQLADRAHSAGLAIGQKNAVELGSAGSAGIGFDFVIAESCEVYEECDDYVELYGEQVLEIEYIDTGREAFDHACEARAGTHPIVLRDRLLAPAGSDGHVFELC